MSFTSTLHSHHFIPHKAEGAPLPLLLLINCPTRPFSVAPASLTIRVGCYTSPSPSALSTPQRSPSRGYGRLQLGVSLGSPPPLPLTPCSLPWWSMSSFSASFFPPSLPLSENYGSLCPTFPHSLPISSCSGKHHQFLLPLRTSFSSSTFSGGHSLPFTTLIYS